MSPEGKASCRFSEDASRRGKLWRLHFSDAQAVLNMDGLTRWQRGEAWENLAFWTPDLSSWFAFRENRWLLTPYHRTVYADAGRDGVISFTLHNNGPASKRVTLSLEFDDKADGSARLPKTEVELKAHGSVQVPLHYHVPSGDSEWQCFVRASVPSAPSEPDDAAFSTWSSLTLRRGTAPAMSPVNLPIKLEPYEHENTQFGYLPEYPLDDHTYFPAGYYANLATMHKRPTEPWSDPRPLVVAPFSEYSIFYHRLTLDRRGALFLSYDYWSTFWFYRTDHPGNRRSLLMSSDGGDTWKLPPSGQFLR